MYAQDYDETVIPFWYVNGAWSGQGWNQRTTMYILAQPYIKNYGIFRCPSGNQNLDVRDPAAPNNVRRLEVSYAYNSLRDEQAGAFDNPAAYLGVCTWQTSGKFGVPMASITTPANTIVLIDSRNIDIWNESLTDYWNSYNNSGTYVARRHNEGFNITFADGHAKWHRKTTRSQWTRAED
jgi:prepilin-type processing-associated H-X9-DG protein